MLYPAELRAQAAQTGAVQCSIARPMSIVRFAFFLVSPHEAANACQSLPKPAAAALGTAPQKGQGYRGYMTGMSPSNPRSTPGCRLSNGYLAVLFLGIGRA